MTKAELVEQIRRGEIDLNNQSLFFKILIKGLMARLSSDIVIRGTDVPHMIMNTGDETMYLENKGQDMSVEPLDISNENYVYNIIPRCVVTPGGITLIPDQLTSPYANGVFQYETEDGVFSFTSEFRRMPLKMSFELEYLVDTYTDFLTLAQQIVSKLSFIRTYTITYLGQSICCSYNIPESFDGENTIEFDGATTDDRRHKMKLSIEVETNMPIFNQESVISTDAYIKNMGTMDSYIDPKTGQLKYVFDMRVMSHGGIRRNEFGEDPHAPHEKKAYLGQDTE